MNTHKNSRLTVHSRQVRVRRVIEDGLRSIDVAQAMVVAAGSITPEYESACTARSV